ncbi:MAG: carboxylating nicotinate-nucleotide diphosphorylase [Planctomycetota bacterium]
MPRAILDIEALDRLIEQAFAEDIGPGDVTTEALIDPGLVGRGVLIARERGILAGMPAVRRLLRKFDKKLKLSNALRDGARLEPDTRIGVISGPAAPMLTVERTLLNFLQYLSGIATTTRRYADAIAGTGAKLLDTRKTLPGWRSLSKYAVTVGGGTNHRTGLYGQVLIKDNHLGASRLSPAEATALARERAPDGILVEVEIETIAGAQAAARAGADIIMLDNMPPARMKKAVAVIRSARPGTIIEASGGITLRNIASVARTGVDWISAGAITHSARALDIALEMEAP